MDRSNNSVVNNFNNSNNSWEEQNNIRSNNNNNFNNNNQDSSLINNQQVKFESNVGENSCREEQSIFRYCEGNLNFATVAADEDEYGFQKKKSLARDPMSHRIIEKRRRDRMNNCLADLSRLIPAEYLKKGRGRVEKTEIIEMAIKHMKHLQAHACNHGTDSCEMTQESTEQQPQPQGGAPIVLEHYRLGYQECLSETMHFLVEVEGFFAGDSLCVQLINHLQKHCEKIVKGDRLNFPRPHRSEASSSSSRGYSGYSGGPSSTSSGSDSGGNGHSSKENNPGPTDWRRNNDVEETPSPLPLPSPHSMTSTMQTLPPPPPPPPTSTNGILSEQEDSLLSLPSESGEPSSSQLRDMLTGASPSILPRRNNNNNSNSNAELSDTGSLYKFKNNIKQRFTAEHHHDEKRRRIMIPSPEIKRDCMESPPPPTAGLSLIKQRQSPSPPIIINNNNEIQSNTNCSSSNSSPLTQNYGVPVFALHSKGSFYVPLTIDNDILSPYMGGYSDNHSQVLHPVTISVNFCGITSAPVHIPTQPAAPMIPWRGDPPGLMPLPKWSVCDRA